MNKEQFRKMFLDTIDNIENRFHPLVWINGKPAIGEGTYIGGFSEINSKGGSITIGKNCDIASFVAINIADSHMRCIGLVDDNEVNDISIGDNVFIGSHSVILGGANIGSYSVIGAGTVVRSVEIPPFSLVIGNPMVIKPRFYQERWEKINGAWDKHDSP